MSPWGLQELLLRRIDMHLAGANWQRGGGKTANRPKPIELPDMTSREERAAKSSTSGAPLLDRLQQLGM